MEEESFSFSETMQSIFGVCQFWAVWRPRKRQVDYNFVWVKFYAIWTLDLLFNAAMIIFILENLDDLEPATVTCFTFFSVYNITVKKIVASFNEKHIKTLAKEFDGEIFSPIGDSQKKLFRDFKSFFTGIYFVFKVGVIGWVGGFALLPWMLLAITKGSNKLILLPIAVPFNVTTYPGWATACIFESLALFHCGSIVVSLDCTFVWFLMFIGVQCDFLCDSLRNLENDDEKFARCVQHHKAILSVKKKVQRIFNGQIASQFFASTGIIIFVLMQLSTIHAGSWMFIISTSYLVDASFQLLLYCWFGNEVIYKSMKIPDAAYHSDWPKFDNGLKRKLVFFIARCQHEIKLEFMQIFDVSVVSFIKVIRTAYSYFSVLKVYYEKNEAKLLVQRNDAK